MKNLTVIFLQEGAGGFSTLILFGGMFHHVFFDDTPKHAQTKTRKKFQEELKRGDWVVTTSGVHGKVLNWQVIQWF